MEKNLQPVDLDERLLEKLQDLENEIRMHENDQDIVLLAYRHQPTIK